MSIMNEVKHERKLAYELERLKKIDQQIMVEEGRSKNDIFIKCLQDAENTIDKVCKSLRKRIENDKNKTTLNE